MAAAPLSRSDRGRGRGADGGGPEVRPDRRAVIALIAAVAVAVCILTIAWAMEDLVAAFERYRGSR